MRDNIFIGFIRSAWHFVRRFIFYAKYLKFESKEIADEDLAEQLLKEIINSNSPFFIGRMGGVELNMCCEYHYIKRHFYKNYSDYSYLWGIRNAGIFPNTRECYDECCEILQRSIKNITLAAVWPQNYEKYFYKKFSNCKYFINWESLYPVINNYTKYLKGKKILVVSPFSKTIKKQYESRSLLFKDENILPSFKLITYTPIVSLGGYESDNIKSWKEALFSMFEDIKKYDFDICLLGCGAYGLALGSMIYNQLNKSVMHIGGSLQLLFGIKGAAYEKREELKPFINKYWVYPSKEETPKVACQVENSCYWNPEYAKEKDDII